MGRVGNGECGSSQSVLCGSCWNVSSHRQDYAVVITQVAAELAFRTSYEGLNGSKSMICELVENVNNNRLEIMLAQQACGKGGASSDDEDERGLNNAKRRPTASTQRRQDLSSVSAQTQPRTPCLVHPSAFAKNASWHSRTPDE